MIADTDQELHAMAASIGVARRWHQAPPKHPSHYDVCLSKRALAAKAGAVEITLRQCAAMCARRRSTGALGSPADAEAWHRKALAAAAAARSSPNLGRERPMEEPSEDCVPSSPPCSEKR